MFKDPANRKKLHKIIESLIECEVYLTNKIFVELNWKGTY